MNLSKELDLAIKLAETGTTAGEYLAGGKEYNTYMTNTEWANFKANMAPDALSEYSAGSGDELSEKSGRPPKMACYGSSSRILYNLSRHKEGFHYEKKLSTTVGGTANIDGFLSDEDRYVFVEAKCHEIYSAKNNSASKSYEKLYNFINEQMEGSLEISMKPSKCGRYLDVEYFADGEPLENFDMKQMISHFLGIATGILKGELDQKQIDFVYLLYDPTELELEPKVKAAIELMYSRTCFECNLVDFTTLFYVIFKFLQAEKYGEVLSEDDLDDLLCRFTFTLSSQEFYPTLLQ
jgi:hypothetical protein